MGVVQDLISDLEEELEVLNRYKDLPEIFFDSITPLWFTHKYDGQYIAGFCEYNSEIYRFQAVYSDFGVDTQVYILHKPTEDQLKIEKERIQDWESMVGFNKSFVAEPGSWQQYDVDKNKLGNPSKFFDKYFDEKHLFFNVDLDYTNNEPEFIFTIE